MNRSDPSVLIIQKGWLIPAVEAAQDAPAAGDPPLPTHPLPCPPTPASFKKVAM